MRYLDEASAWLLFLLGMSHMIVTELFPMRGRILDTGLLYILVAMLNLVRVRNDQSVRLLKTFCIGGNVSALIFEVDRWHQYQRFGYVGDAILLALLTIFSITRKQVSSSAPDMNPTNVVVPTMYRQDSLSAMPQESKKVEGWKALFGDPFPIS